METIISAFQALLSGVGPFFILLGLLIFVHELGHFAVAKFFNVRVEVFSLGFGKKILQFQKGETKYCLSLIPLGGYVKMYGDDPTAEVPEAEKPRSFLHKPVSQRFAIVLAGPLMNLFFAALLFVLIALVGEEVPGTKIGDVAQGSAAYEAGFRSGDKILKINSENVETWQAVQEQIKSSSYQALQFEVEREHSQEKVQVTATPEMGENDNILSTDQNVGTINGLSQESLSTLVGVTSPTSPAALAGLKSLDLIMAVNDKEVDSYRNLQTYLKEALNKEGDKVQLKVKAYGLEGLGPERNVELSYSPELKNADEKSPLLPLGIEPAGLYLLSVKADSPAGKSGLTTGDHIIALDGKPIHDWSAVIERVKNYKSDQRGIEFTYRREGKDKTVTIVPEMTQLMNAKGQEESRYTVGIVSGHIQTPNPPVFHQIEDPIEATKIGVVKTYEWTGMLVMGIVRLVQGDVSVRNIGGVITIGRFASHSFEAGLSTFMKMMAIISLNLFLINLLPIPVLDGGHLVFFSIEALKGTPLSMRKMELAQQIGMVILITLMVFSFYNDINNFFFSGW